MRLDDGLEPTIDYFRKLLASLIVQRRASSLFRRSCSR